MDEVIEITINKYSKQAWHGLIDSSETAQFAYTHLHTEFRIVIFGGVFITARSRSSIGQLC